MRYFLCMLLVVWNAGCTTMRTVENPDPAMAVSQLAIGDTVEVITVDGRKLHFKVESIDDEQMTGKVVKPGRSNDRVSVPIDEIRLVSRAELDGVKTGAAAVGSAAFLGVIIFLIVIPGWMLSAML